MRSIVMAFLRWSAGGGPKLAPALARTQRFHLEWWPTLNPASLGWLGNEFATQKK
jgi:hypothetical protein